MRNNHLLANCKNFPSVHIFLLHIFYLSPLQTANGELWHCITNSCITEHPTRTISSARTNHLWIVFPKFKLSLKEQNIIFGSLKKILLFHGVAFFFCLRESNAWKQFTSVSFKRMKLFFQNDLWCHSSPFVVWSGQTVQEKNMDRRKVFAINQQMVVSHKICCITKGKRSQTYDWVIVKRIIELKNFTRTFSRQWNRF